MMSDRQDEEGEVSKLLNNIYRCADKSRWYDGVAEAYDRARPRYPASILARMQEIARLQPDKSILYRFGNAAARSSFDRTKISPRVQLWQ